MTKSVEFRRENKKTYISFQSNEISPCRHARIRASNVTLEIEKKNLANNSKYIASFVAGNKCETNVLIEWKGLILPSPSAAFIFTHAVNEAKIDNNHKAKLLCIKGNHFFPPPTKIHKNFNGKYFLSFRFRDAPCVEPQKEWQKKIRRRKRKKKICELEFSIFQM